MPREKTMTVTNKNSKEDEEQKDESKTLKGQKKKSKRDARPEDQKKDQSDDDDSSDDLATEEIIQEESDVGESDGGSDSANECDDYDEEFGEDYDDDVDDGDNDDDYDDNDDDDYDDNGDEEEEEEDKSMTKKNHAESLNKLEQTDPEFYKYLKENDQDLLKFGELDSEDDSGEENEEREKCEKVHKPPHSLEVASDDSDFEEPEDTKSDGSSKITLMMVKKWENDLVKKKKSLTAISTVIKAFHAALLRAIGGEDTEFMYKVDGSAVFNSVVQLCITSLFPCLKDFLNIPSTSVTKKHVENATNWNKVKSLVRGYILDLVKLINNVTSGEVLSVLLKHLHQMMPFASCLPTIIKPVLKRLISLWSSKDDDTVRVIAFLCVLHLTTANSTYLQPVLKMMYISYVANSKFVSPTTLPGINFMQKSLAEMFSLNESVSYNHAFLYIRQLAIHLRSAVTLKKKESIQAVYNWQYINSLRLWVNILSSSQERSILRSLVYPIVQIIIGCIKLIPTAQYLPLRFHCIQTLIQLSEAIGVFIPVLPFLLEALSLVNFGVRHTKMSLKPMDFTCVLRLSKIQMQENAFKDAIIDNFYQYTLAYMTSESYRISFPDTVVPSLLQIRKFLKECKNSNYTRKLKSLIEKVEENSKLISNERNKCGVALTDEKGIRAWESNMKMKGTPLITFHNAWVKINQRQTARKVTNTIEISEFNLPTIKKPKKSDSGVSDQKKDTGDNFVLFPSDDEEDDENFGNGFQKVSQNESADVTKNSSRKRKQVEKSTKTVKTKKKKTSTDTEQTTKVIDDIGSDKDSGDIVKDFNLSEFINDF